MYIDIHELLQGAITLYRRDSEGGNYNSQNWYAALRIADQKTIRRSLKTTSLDEAVKRAQNLYFDLSQRARVGLSLAPKQFESIAKRFLQQLSKDVETWESLGADGQANMGNISPNILEKNRPIIENYLVPFFSGKHIQEITEQDIENYKNFRLGYWIDEARLAQPSITYVRNGRKVTRPKREAEKSVPSHSTINKELTALKKVFEYARKEKIVTHQDIPPFNRLRKPAGYTEKRERPSFTNDELILLLDTVREMYQSQKNSRIASAQYRLYLYIQLMSYTGMRVTEAKNLKFSDIETRNCGKKSEHIAIRVSGKNKGRDLVPLPHFAITIELLQALSKLNSQINNWTFSDDGYVLSDEFGQRINSFDKALSNALEKCNLLIAKNGKKRNAGSFRSFYITSALVSGMMTHIQLALNCGTSVSVIEKHYNRMSTSNISEKFNFENVTSDTFYKHMELDAEESIATGPTTNKATITSGIKMRKD